MNPSKIVAQYLGDAIPYGNYTLTGVTRGIGNIDNIQVLGLPTNDGRWHEVKMGDRTLYSDRPSRCFYCESLLARDTLQCPHCGGSKRHG